MKKELNGKNGPPLYGRSLVRTTFIVNALIDCITANSL